MTVNTGSLTQPKGSISISYPAAYLPSHAVASPERASWERGSLPYFISHPCPGKFGDLGTYDLIDRVALLEILSTRVEAARDLNES